ncbi:MAG: hypothetical protein IID34_14455 [Planctomycetes bacterium]|nr:hypothetical protein [Planctomycetota bacterium]
MIVSAEGVTGAGAGQGTEPPWPTTQPSGRIVEVKTFESQWERYTREFIARYSLKDSQEQKAWSILKKCQDQGNSYIRRHRAELDKLEARVGELSKSTAAAADREQLAAVRQRLGEKLAPIDDIFENQLKPRLDKLPTRKQRAAVKEARKGKDR